MLRITYCLLTLLGWALATPSFAGAHNTKTLGAQLQGVRMLHCSANKNCLEIKASVASQGVLFNGISFHLAQITTSGPNQAKKTFTSNSTYFDLASNRIYLEGINQNAKAEAVYNMDTGQLHYF